MSEHRLPTSVPRSIAGSAHFSSAMLGRMSFNLTWEYLVLMGADWFTLFMNSAMPNRPSASATSSMPSSSCGKPKVNRSAPVSRSEPTMPNNRPSTVIATPFSGDPLASVEPASNPSSINVQTSAGPNFSATSTSTGARNIISVMPQDAPMNEPITVMPSATPPLPCLVIGKPSRQVTACGGWHGRLSRMEQIAPPYCEP